MTVKNKTIRKKIATPQKKKTSKSERTKSVIILDRIKRPKGACLADLRKATGWQDHSIRAAISRIKKKGYQLTREKSTKGISRYHVIVEV